MLKICVYGASSTELDPSFITAGEKLGRIMAEKGIGLVFGGGANGMMGAVARGVYSKGGSITGVAPKFFNADGILFEHCDEMIRTETMRQRKQMMDDLSDGFIVTPGGIGTFEEFFEVLTLRQLLQSKKPIAVLNTNGYYNALQSMMQNAIDGKFAREECLELYTVVDTPEDAISYIQSYKAKDGSLENYKNI